jgi:hypothetical protein
MSQRHIYFLTSRNKDRDLVDASQPRYVSVTRHFHVDPRFINAVLIAPIGNPTVGSTKFTAIFYSRSCFNISIDLRNT